MNTFPGYCGRAADIGVDGRPDTDGAVLVAGCGSATLVHELLHLMGLYHTHHRRLGLTCHTSGDRVCDTPPDPGPPHSAREGAGTCEDRSLAPGCDCAASNEACAPVCRGDESPLFTNLMSYYHCGRTRPSLTPMQINRARCNMIHSMAHAIAELPARCGDGRCSGSESCSSCAADCGACPSCGGQGEACCAGNSCAAEHLCERGTCHEIPGGLRVRRYRDCRDLHWSSTRTCHPGPSPSTGCSGCATSTPSGCSSATCWVAESAFWSLERRPTYGSHTMLYHCFASGGNLYQTSPCGAGREGDPHELGYIATSPNDVLPAPLYVCGWTTRTGVYEHFLTLNEAECTRVGSVVGGRPIGYVAR